MRVLPESKRRSSVWPETDIRGRPSSSVIFPISRLDGDRHSAIPALRPGVGGRSVSEDNAMKRLLVSAALAGSLALGGCTSDPYRDHDLVVVALGHGENERLLAWKILVERTYADACDLGDSIRAGLVETLVDQNTSSGFDERCDGRSRSLLRGLFPGIFRDATGHFVRLPDASIKRELSLIFSSARLASPWRMTNVRDAERPVPLQGLGE